MGKLRDFINGHVPLDNIKIHDSHMVTEVVIMYRVIDPTNSDTGIEEMFDYTTSEGCSMAMARGIVDVVTEEWIAYSIENALGNKEDEDDDN